MYLGLISWLAGGSILLAGPVYASTRVGDMNMDWGCKQQFGEGYYSLTHATSEPYSWVCTTGWPESERWPSMGQVCRDMYGADAFADRTNGGAYDWWCSKP